MTYARFLIGRVTFEGLVRDFPSNLLCIHSRVDQQLVHKMWTALIPCCNCCDGCQIPTYISRPILVGLVSACIPCATFPSLKQFWDRKSSYISILTPDRFWICVSNAYPVHAEFERSIA